MQKVINLLIKHIEQLHGQYAIEEAKSDNPEMLIDYMMSCNTMENIVIDIELFEQAVELLKKFDDCIVSKKVYEPVLISEQLPISNELINDLTSLNKLTEQLVKTNLDKDWNSFLSEHAIFSRNDLNPFIGFDHVDSMKYILNN